MWGCVLSLWAVLLFEVSEADVQNSRTNKTFSDFWFSTKYKNRNITWMMMSDETGVVVSAVLDGATPIQKVTFEEIEFWLWNNETGKTPIIIPFRDGGLLLETVFELQSVAKTIILIHGFTNTFIKSPFLTEMAEVYLEKNDSNIIGVNWSKLASIPWYGKAVNNSAYVGCLTGKLIRALRAIEKPGEKSEIHIVAHNLGTLVAGSAANCVGGKKIDRITGLDPPGILTSSLPNSKKLDKNDANLVEILHTSGNYIGINEPVGHRDFYANGGIWPQPGCEFDIADRCSIRRAFWYYKEAVKDEKKVKATKCSSYFMYLLGFCEGNPKVYLVNNEPPKKEGKFYFVTRSKPQF